MTAYPIINAVIPERQDDGHSDKFLVVAPEDRIVWVATTRPGQIPDLSAEERKRSVLNAKVKSLLGKLERDEFGNFDLVLDEEDID
jgi:hypothetical protein